jgi:hypothetical protein
MLVGKSLLQSVTPERYLNQVGSGLNRKHQTRLEMPAWNKHSSLLGLFASYEENSVLCIGPLIFFVDLESKKMKNR